MYCVHKCNVALFSRHQTILFPFTETEDLDNYLHHADYPGKYLSFTHWHDSTGIRTSNSKATNPSKTNCEEIKKTANEREKSGPQPYLAGESND